ncbi:hypothetical protein V8C35DRAFT_321542 [Trichoderma chlorosporum]
MTLTSPKPIERTETADEYGRRENCFRNYRRHPFTFQSNVTSIQSTKEATDKDGFVAQPGLKMVPLPSPQPVEDVFDEHQQYRESLQKLLHDSPSKLSSSANNNFVNELVIPVGELDLGSCLESDLQEYLHQVHVKRYSDPFQQWLPLVCTRVDRDEGLIFPSELNRLWELLHREFDIDQPILSDTAANLVREQSRSLTASEYADLLLQQTKIKPYQYSCLDPLTPPLSPVSDDDEPFIPDGAVATIDLVSEPSTPDKTTFEAIQRETESDPVVSSTFMTSPFAGELPQLLQTCHPTTEEVRAEVPVVLTSSDAPSEPNAFTDPFLSLIGDNGDEVSNTLEEMGHFEDAFMTLLEDRCYYANQLVNQECFHPTDSASRISVPLLDFDIPPPQWTIGDFTARTHFLFLRKSMPCGFHMLPVAKDPQSEDSLRWAVFPLEKREPVRADDLKVPDDTVAKYLSHEPAPTLTSLDFVTRKLDLDVLCIQEDEELESTSVLDDETDEAPPPAGTQHHAWPNGSKSEKRNHPLISENNNSPDLGRSTRRKLDDDAARLLPKSYDTSATSILLHNFMELRGMKRPRLNTEPSVVHQPTGPVSAISGNEPSTTNDRESSTPGMSEEMPPAPIPQFEIPSEKAAFIISVDLARPILRRLESMWAPEKLIDMDFSRHNSTAWLPDAAQPRGAVSPLSIEADITLSSSTGIIITNLLKVRQRPLPGSQSQTPLRERVQKVSQKYETLIVLVSESQSTGEYMGTLSPSDITAYADFLSFAAALDGDIHVYFIPGATETMASWILALMCQYSSRSESRSRFLSSEETPWEIFLRRAGMNVTAAKILSKTLFEQAGASGLAMFLNTPVSERVARFGPLLGGEKVLLLTANLLDRRWEL